MNFKVRTYNESEDYKKILKLIESEGKEWKEYLNPKYQVNLEQSITYVAYTDEVLCGYARSMNDFSLFIWVIDLLVGKKYRGHSVGKKLMDKIINDYPDQDVYVMSDADGYYEKLGYKKEGSIFKIE